MKFLSNKLADENLHLKQGVLYTLALPLIEFQQLKFMINWS